ncbi:MAG: DUF4276 family protein [Nitrospirae bacterium]|nr:DUF4276 family protein [Nitrospirota bacterium]
MLSHLLNYGIVTEFRGVLISRRGRHGCEMRGGFRNSRGCYDVVKDDIKSWLKADKASGSRFTTMFDLYALPKEFPGRTEANQIRDPYEKVAFLEKKLKDDIDDYRFIPYIQLHEFEALILSDPQKLDWKYLEHERQIANIIQMVANKGGNPELINDGYETCPSRRIISEIPEYEGSKATAGPLTAAKIGLPTLRQKCAHFDQRVSKLENCKLESLAR